MQYRDNKLFQASTILFFLNILASAMNYLCQIFFARVLSVSTYGEINAIFSFMMVVAVPGTTLTMIVARYFAEDNIDKAQYLKKQEYVVLLLTIVVYLVLLLFQHGIGKILSIKEESVLLLAFALAATGFFQPLFSGVFSGCKRFILVGIYSLCIPIYKILAIVGACIYSYEDRNRLYAILIIMLVGVIVTALYGKIKSNKLCNDDKNQKVDNPQKLYSIEDLNALILNMSIMLYMNIDLLVVRYHSSELESGLYSSVLLFGRIIYYFSITLGTVLLPSVAGEKNNEKRKRTLNKTIVIMFLFAVICLLPINLFKRTLINLLYGEQYLGASKYVIYVSCISIALSIYTIMANYVVGIGKTKKTTIVMILIDVILIAIAFLFTNIQIILILLATVGILGAVIIFLLNNGRENKIW